jgi:hypothetical protein
MIRWLSKKIRSMARQRGDRPASQFRNLKDPELAAIAAIAQHRRLDAERSLEAAFRKQGRFFEECRSQCAPFR